MSRADPFGSAWPPEPLHAPSVITRRCSPWVHMCLITQRGNGTPVPIHRHSTFDCLDRQIRRSPAGSYIRSSRSHRRSQPRSKRPSLCARESPLLGHHRDDSGLVAGVVICVPLKEPRSCNHRQRLRASGFVRHLGHGTQFVPVTAGVDDFVRHARSGGAWHRRLLYGCQPTMPVPRVFMERASGIGEAIVACRGAFKLGLRWPQSAFILALKAVILS